MNTRNLNKSKAAVPVSRIGRSVELIPVGPEHSDFLYGLAIDDDVGWRWRFGGTVPRRDAFEQSLWNGILCQFIVREKQNGTLVGSVLAYNSDINHGFAHVAVGLLAGAVGSGIGVEASDLFAAHLFSGYRLRKLYFEVPEYNISQFESALGWLLKEEGILRDHTYYNGCFWDRRILAMYREDYENINEQGRELGRRRRAILGGPQE